VTPSLDARGPQVAIGRRLADGAPLAVALEALRKHVTIFAGSGSGKTVLIRRLVEECALLGVSAIVIDPNNDLARLGDRWPQVPPGWYEGDPRRAEEYLAATDVVIWTPGRAGGRPLSFQPLPDFRSLADDPDEFAEAVEAAVAFIVPRIRLDANTNKAQYGQAVLRKALAYYGRRGATSLKGFAALLSDLPDGVSELANAPRIAAELAQSLTAAMDNDPLFGGAGTPVDPGLLVSPPEGKRARISVISLVGLPALEQRQSFVSQLQMELFVWFKRHPAQDRPLGALLVMDEAQTFAPAAGVSAATRSTVLLASQARKYGLGLVFATQAPKGLHNHIPGNSSTQFFGLLNAPIQISAARDMARSKGGDVPDISRLSSGEFYVALEGGAFFKTRMPMSLSWHPKAPLTTEEVIQKSRG
jgi:Helicase HerA, central domain